MTRDTTARATLITVRLSHYCEKARWALDRLAVPYREDAHAPPMHRIFTTRNHGGTVPVLVHGDLVLTDSTDILVHADRMYGGDALYPRDATLRREVEALEERFDAELGPHARRWAYHILLADPKGLRAVWSQGVPALEARLLKVLMPLALRLVRRAYRITPESAQRSHERFRRVFDEVDERLADGRRFLVGNRFTAADLTFASLAAPVVFPPGYRAAHPALEQAPAEMREEASRLRALPSGQFVMRMFAEERDSVLRR